MSIYKLTSSDGQEFTIDELSAKRSELFKGIIEDNPEELTIPLDVQGSVLIKVVEYLIHYQSTEPRVIPKPLPGLLEECIDQWDIDFLAGIDLDLTFDLVNAANYLDIKSLLELSCAKIASLMKGKSSEEIRIMFNIECDLTEEELKEYDDYKI